MLLIESDAPGLAAPAELDAAEAAILAAGATSVVRAADATEADWLRQARRLALRALERKGTVRMEDVGVPRSRVPELLAGIERITTAHGVRCATFGHAGDGNLHPNLIFDRDDPDAARLTHLVRDEIFQVALDLGIDINAVDKHNETAMHGAAYKNLPNVVKLLVAKGATIEVWNRPNKFGWTPLVIAAGYRFGNFKPSAETEAAVREVMIAAGVTPPTTIVATNR